jgi:hypothetical protein
MMHPVVWIFIFLSAAFAATHAFAVWAYFYYAYWWFDIFMHSFGGFLITLGLFAFGTFSIWRRQPRLVEVLSVLLVAVIAWELFEQYFGLYNPIGYLLDTSIDMLLGVGAGLVSYVILKKIVKIS